MGLDVYVGTLTRYYAGAWETVVQQAAREAGVEVQIVRPNEPADRVTDPAEIEGAVVAWREALNAGLEVHLAAPLDWTEGMGPADFDFTFRAEDAAGNTVVIGIGRCTAYPAVAAQRPDVAGARPSRASCDATISRGMHASV